MEEKKCLLKHTDRYSQIMGFAAVLFALHFSGQIESWTSAEQKCKQMMMVARRRMENGKEKRKKGAQISRWQSAPARASFAIMFAKKEYEYGRLIMHYVLPHIKKRNARFLLFFLTPLLLLLWIWALLLVLVPVIAFRIENTAASKKSVFPSCSPYATWIQGSIISSSRLWPRVSPRLK